jgi:hypothetical protein
MQNNTAALSAKPAAARLFSRKIGNTTFLVSVAFSEKSAESIEDKIIRLAASEPYEREVEKCV